MLSSQCSQILSERSCSPHFPQKCATHQPSKVVNVLFSNSSLRTFLASIVMLVQHFNGNVRPLRDFFLGPLSIQMIADACSTERMWTHRRWAAAGFAIRRCFTVLDLPIMWAVIADMAWPSNGIQILANRGFADPLLGCEQGFASRTFGQRVSMHADIVV